MLFEKWSEVVARHGGQVALWHVGTDEKVTFEELDQRAEECVQDGGIWRADGDSRDFFPTLIAAWKRQVPVVLMEEGRQELREIQGELPAGVALIKQTCGASGVERSLFFGEHQVWAEARRNIEGLGLVPERPGLAAISLVHSYGFGCLALPLLLGGVSIHIVPAPLPMFMEKVLDQEERVFLPGVPAIWKTWWKTGVAGHRAINLALSAGAPLSLELERGVMEECGLKVHNFYGTSETGAVAFDESGELRSEAGGIGKTLPGVDVGIDVGGRLLVRSESQAIGTDEPLAEGELDAEFYRTTDFAEEKEGRLILTGSSAKAINVAGRKVSPARIKRELLRIEGVEEVVIDKSLSPDFERYEEISATVTTSLDKRALREALRSSLESWEIPRHWTLLTPVPSR